MQKLFASLVTAVGGLAVILSAWLYFNRSDTIDAQQTVSRAQFELDKMDFDDDFSRQQGTQIPPERAARNAERRKLLEARIASAEAQMAAAEKKRQDAAGALDRTLSDLDEGKLKPSSNEPGPVAVLIAGLILFGVGLFMRAVGRKDSKAEDTEAAAPVRLADKLIDRAGQLFSSTKKEKAQ